MAVVILLPLVLAIGTLVTLVRGRQGLLLAVGLLWAGGWPVLALPELLVATAVGLAGVVLSRIMTGQGANSPIGIFLTVGGVALIGGLTLGPLAEKVLLGAAGVPLAARAGERGRWGMVLWLGGALLPAVAVVLLDLMLLS